MLLPRHGKAPNRRLSLCAFWAAHLGKGNPQSHTEICVQEMWRHKKGN